MSDIVNMMLMNDIMSEHTQLHIQIECCQILIVDDDAYVMHAMGSIHIVEYVRGFVEETLSKLLFSNVLNCDLLSLIMFWVLEQFYTYFYIIYVLKHFWDTRFHNYWYQSKTLFGGVRVLHVLAVYFDVQSFRQFLTIHWFCRTKC